MIGLVSLNYKIAPLKIREHFYLFPDEISKIHSLINKKVKTKGFFVISTCNRTEIYFEVSSKDFSENQVFHSVIMSLSRFKKFNDGLRPYIKKKKGIEKISKHMFRLSNGIDPATMDHNETCALGHINPPRNNMMCAECADGYVPTVGSGEAGACRKCRKW